MGRRTINAHKLTFNKLREPEHLLSPADINGETLIDIVERCALSLEEEGVIELRGDTHIVVGRVSRFNNNILIMEAMSGKSGEPGVLHDLEGASDDIPIGENQAPMSGCRALLFCPGNGQMAMWFSEYSSRSSGARDLLTLLKRRWPHLNTGAKFNDARVIMSDALLDEGKITEIEVRFTRLSSDLADGTQTMLGTYSSSFRPDRRRPLSAKLLDVF